MIIFLPNSGRKCGSVLDACGLCTEEKGWRKVSPGMFYTSLSPSHVPGARRTVPREQEGKVKRFVDVAFRRPPLAATARTCQAIAIKIVRLVRKVIT